MSVETTTRKQSFVLNGVTSTFDFTFRALSATDIKAIATTGGTDTQLVYTTDYTVSLEADGVGGTLTLVSAATTGTGTLTVYRETTNTQESDYEDFNQFPADTLENDLDRATCVNQEQTEDLQRTVKMAITSTLTGSSVTLPAPEASKLIGWNAAANGFENNTNPSVAAAASAAAALLSANAASTSASTALGYANAASTSSTNALSYANASSSSSTAASSYATTALNAAVGISVKQYGAVGDGIADDTVAIQAAINSGNKNIFFPQGSYAFTGITISSGTSALHLVGASYGYTTLLHTEATGNGITFAGEADNFVMENITINSSGSSTGFGIYSAQSATSPLRDFLFNNVSISGFKYGIHIEGLLNGRIVGGRQGGQGKAIAGGIGIQLGKDITNAGNHCIVENVYVSSYETNIYNKYCSPLHIKDSITGTSVTGLQVDNGITYAQNICFDSDNDNAINQVGGYLYWSGNFSSVGTQAISSATHRIFKQAYNPARIDAYLGSSQLLSSSVTTLVKLDTEREDTEALFDTTASEYKYTCAFPGYHLINGQIMYTPTVPDKIYAAHIYKNGASQTTAYGISGSAGFLSVYTTRILWLEKNDYIQLYGWQNSGAEQTMLASGTGNTTYINIIELNY